MEARFKKIINPADASFIVKTDDIPAKNPWHYHPEIELLFFVNAKGTRFIGDNINDIANGEILLLGENLPHCLQRDKQFYELHNAEIPQVIIVQFDRNFLGSDLWNKTEFLPIADMLNKAARGLRFSSQASANSASLIYKLIEQKGVRKIMSLLCLLEELAHNHQYDFLSSCGFIKNYNETDDKINKVYEYTINNFMEDISLEKIAGLVYFSQSAFCRYFKNKTGKTYSQFVAEVRIGYACKLLLQHKLNISEICYECGYKNISNFNRHFKDIIHVTPSEYQKSFDIVSKVA